MMMRDPNPTDNEETPAAEADAYTPLFKRYPIFSEEELRDGVRNAVKTGISRQALQLKAEIISEMQLTQEEAKMTHHLEELKACKKQLTHLCESIEMAKSCNRAELFTTYERRKANIQKSVNDIMEKINESEHRISELKDRWEHHRINFKENVLKIIQRHIEDRRTKVVDPMNWTMFMPEITISRSTSDGQQETSVHVVKYFE